MHKVKPIFQNYNWGSQSVLQELFGLEKNGLPIAEVWFGTHKKADNISKFSNGQIPYLFKILAVEKCLSLQVHPNKKTAKQGFDKENASGLPLDAENRVYRDPNAKPEMAVALTPFLAAVGVKSAKSKQKFAEILQNKDSISKKYLEDITQKVTKKIENAKSNELNNLLSEQAFLYARQDYPDDPTALLLLEMNVVRLLPGEAIFLPDGVIHAYIRGQCLEIMENSDNVFRAGLTKKYINPELILQYGIFQPLISYEPSVIARNKFSADYISPNFGITIVEGNVKGVKFGKMHKGPKILVCLKGEFVVDGEKISQGDCFFFQDGENIESFGSGACDEGKFVIAHL
ncbi:MAG: mannose-6-phosphate isomerase, class I [Bifidobacteriaceae bacterium]|jgi:mannose-6-phosphate isomerase|nr:mannose-6-phosphate isomerase, class I [Bifidobacteriaceae bacterium]